jgi:Tfp pilus assembly protein PilX
MTFLFRKTAARRIRGDDGNILITVVVVSLVIGVLSSLALSTGRQADWASSSDRNHEQSLGVAEAGVQQVISRISAEAAGTDTSAPNFWALTPGTTSPSSCSAGGQCSAARDDSRYSFTTPQGKYWYWVTRTTQGYILDAQSKSGATHLGRGRHIQVTLTPPARFPGGHKYALFSYLSIVVQNNDQVLDGDVFANDNISISQSNHNTANDPTLRGSLTAARGWISLDSNVYITGNAWSGGPNYDQHWAMALGGSSTIGGWAKASATDPPSSCMNSDYNVPMANGARIVGDLTTLGDPTGSGTVVGTINRHVCTAAAPAQALDGYLAYTSCGNCYDQSSYHEFATVAEFQSWLTNHLTDFHGTFIVSAPTSGPNAPSQSNRIDLTGAQLTGPTTIVTNAPVYTGTLDDSAVTIPDNTLVIVSHYQPPDSTACDTEHDSSDCAIHVKNNFALNADGTCKTATLLYADKGPVAIKNGQTVCGSVISNGIVVKNGQTITYDDRISKIVGFGPATYEVSRWQELASS